MQWRETIAGLLNELGTHLRDDRSARIAAVTGLAVLLAATLLTVLLARRRNQRVPIVADSWEDRPDLGDWGKARVPGRPEGGPGGSGADDVWPIDRVLPRRIGGTLGLAIVVAVGVWLLGLALAPSIPAFLAAREWHFQPVYIAAHIVAVRLFVLAYTRGFARGVAHLAVPRRSVRTLVASVLGFPGAAIALIVAIPFAALDFLYLFSDRYTRLGGADAVLPIDYLMWLIWSVEWFLNAFIWVVLIGFLVKTWWIVSRHPFRAPIEIVLHDRQYRPFLQMSAQGASIVLAFTIVTVTYIWYTGGELTDYAGLAITAVLLLLSFLPSWLLLRSKVSRAVENETLAMRRRLLKSLHDAEVEASVAPVRGEDRTETPGRSLERRLDATVAILRISYLESSHQSLGASEARAVLIRMLAPAASVGWQVAKSHGALLSDLQGYLAKLM